MIGKSRGDFATFTIVNTTFDLLHGNASRQAEKTIEALESKAKELATSIPVSISHSHTQSNINLLGSFILNETNVIMIS